MNTRKGLLIVAAFSFVLAISCVVPSGEIKQVSYDEFSSFTKVIIKGNFDAVISYAPQRKVFIEADAVVFDSITLDENEITKTLLAEYDGSTCSGCVMRVIIYCPEVSAVTIKDAAELRLCMKNLDILNLEAENASSFYIDVDTNVALFSASDASKITGNLLSSQTEIIAEAASHINLKGNSGKKLQLKVSEASSADLADFPAEIVDAYVSSASIAKVNVSSYLDALVEETSSLVYTGSGIKRDVSYDITSSLVQD